MNGDEFLKSLGAPRYICGPMVDASEVAFRMLVRKYGVDLAYTPMLNSRQFICNEKMRRETFSTCQGDRPLVAQVAGDDPEILLEASKLIQREVDAVDINFGCPQHIAKRGHYGAYLQDEWDLIRRLISTLHVHLEIPVWCKIRVFPEQEKTLAYAKMIEDAGCQVLAVHGRTRENKGKSATPADWNIIGEVKSHLSIPVIANGNVSSLAEAESCFKVTGCDAVMSAYPLLENPQLFCGVTNPDVFALSREYLHLADQYNVTSSQIRGHLFKLLKTQLAYHADLNEQLGSARVSHQFWNLIEELEDRVTRGVTSVSVLEKKKHAQELKKKKQRDAEAAFTVLDQDTDMLTALLGN